MLAFLFSVFRAVIAVCDIDIVEAYFMFDWLRVVVSSVLQSYSNNSILFCTALVVEVYAKET
jgi:hypothetical protein